MEKAKRGSGHDKASNSSSSTLSKRKEGEGEREEEELTNKTYEAPEMETLVSHDAKKQSWFSYCVAIVALCLFSGMFYIVGVTYLVCFYQIIVHGSLIAAAAVAVLIALSFYPSTILWQEFIDLYVWQTMCEYFSFTVKVPKIRENYSPQEKYMFVEFPHGVVPFGFILSATAVQKIMPGLRVEGAIASVLFRVPVIRQLCHWFGSRPATERNIRYLLDRGSVGIMAGGIAELFLSSREHEILYVKKRKGFVKLALEKGCAIVPCYHFGNTQLFDFCGGRLFSLLSRRIRTSLLLFYGRWYLPIPYQHPITMVIGEPIHVKQCSNPTHEQIEELHKKVVDAVHILFEQHKGSFGWGHKKLEIR